MHSFFSIMEFLLYFTYIYSIDGRNDRLEEAVLAERTNLGVHLAQVVHDAVQIQFTSAEDHVLT